MGPWAYLYLSCCSPFAHETVATHAATSATSRRNRGASHGLMCEIVSSASRTAATTSARVRLFRNLVNSSTVDRSSKAGVRRGVAGGANDSHARRATAPVAD